MPEEETKKSVIEWDKIVGNLKEVGLGSDLICKIAHAIAKSTPNPFDDMVAKIICVLLH